jgi:hypothetical protein
MGAGPEATLFNVLRGVVRPLANRNPILSQRRGGMQGLSASRVSPWLRENIGFPSIETRFSHGDTEKAGTTFSGGFSASPRLRENIRVLPIETPIFSQRRGGAEECRGYPLRGFPRGSVRTSGFPQSKPGSLTETRRHGEGRNNFFRGFLSVSAPPREHPGFADQNPDFLAETPRRGGMRSRPLHWFPRGSVPP